MEFECGQEGGSVAEVINRDFDHDAFFVPERRARSEVAVGVVTTVRDELAEWERQRGSRRRVRKATDQQNHDRMVEALVCEAARAHRIDPTRCVALSLGRQRRSRYEPRPYEPMRPLLENLGAALGFLSVTFGVRPEHGRGRMTTFSAGPRLLCLAERLDLHDFGRSPGAEPIVLRNTKTRVAEHAREEDVADAFETWTQARAELGDLVNYEDNKTSVLLRHQMNAINAALDNADIGLDLNALGGKAVDPGDRWLRRMFNNGHTDFRHGGRLAGGYWMDLPKANRLGAIKINGEPVVELDFKAMMPRLLYARAGLCYPADGDPYTLEGAPFQCRDGVKKLFASLMFGPTALHRWPRGVRKLFPRNASRPDVIELLRRQHALVADAFGTMAGFDLLRIESDIIVEVLLQCLGRGIVVLPIHDAVLCPASKEAAVEDQMLLAFTRVTVGGVGAVSRST